MTAFPMEPEIQRDGWLRPLVIPPQGGKPTPYTRCTTFVSALEDTSKLAMWKQRMVAIGLSRRNDLLLSAASLSVDDKSRLDELCEAALNAAAASAKATTGTALHKMAETLDRGGSIEHLPPDARRDLAAYEAATKCLTALHIERFCVLDDMKIGGTPDRVVEYDGKRYIADIKTGGVDFGQLKIAMQLAVYAHSELYDISTGRRSALNVDQQRAIVIHLPAGSGTCELLWADIATAWEAVPLAGQVRDWRRRGARLLSTLSGTIDTPLPDVVEQSAEQQSQQWDSERMVRESALRNAVAQAVNADELTAIWSANREHWNDELTELARARKQLIA